MMNTKPLPSLGSAPGSRLPVPPANREAPQHSASLSFLRWLRASSDCTAGCQRKKKELGAAWWPTLQYPVPCTLGKQLRRAGRVGRAPPACGNQQLLVTLLTGEQSRLSGVKGVSCLFMSTDTLSFCAVHSPWRCFVAAGPPLILSFCFAPECWQLLDSFQMANEHLYKVLQFTNHFSHVSFGKLHMNLMVPTTANPFYRCSRLYYP